MITDQDFKQISGALRVLGKNHEAVKLVTQWMAQQVTDFGIVAHSPNLTTDQRQFWAGYAHACEGYQAAWAAFLESPETAAKAPHKRPAY